jgi:hypothetical protein
MKGIGQQSCQSSMDYYMKSAWRDIRKRKCNYCLALCSTIIVVTITIVSQTVIARTPLIWLKIAENNSGQQDMRLSHNYVDIYDREEI